MYEIEFEDWGQDFLRWAVDSEGIVVQSSPCQGWLWCGSRVLECPVPGGKVHFMLKHVPDVEVATIRYPVLRVRSVAVPA